MVTLDVTVDDSITEVGTFDVVTFDVTVDDSITEVDTFGVVTFDVTVDDYHRGRYIQCGNT